MLTHSEVCTSNEVKKSPINFFQPNFDYFFQNYPHLGSFVKNDLSNIKSPKQQPGPNVSILMIY